MADLLYTKIRAARRSLRDVSRELGLPAGRLSQVLAGRGRLEIDVVYEVLAALELHPDAFFTELNARLAPAEGAGDRQLLPPGPISRVTLEKLIEEKVRDLTRRRDP